MENITILKEKLIEVDLIIRNLDSVLDSCQPNLEGKIRIFYWKTHGRRGKAEPVIVRRTKNIKPFSERLDLKDLNRRALSTRQFSRNYPITKQALKIASEMLRYRSTLVSTINEVERKVRCVLVGNKYKSSAGLTKLISLDAQVRFNLERDDLIEYYKPIESDISSKITIYTPTDPYLDDTL